METRRNIPISPSLWFVQETRPKFSLMIFNPHFWLTPQYGKEGGEQGIDEERSASNARGVDISYHGGGDQADQAFQLYCLEMSPVIVVSDYHLIKWWLYQLCLRVPWVRWTGLYWPAMTWAGTTLTSGHRQTCYSYIMLQPVLLPTPGHHGRIHSLYICTDNQTRM